MSRNRIIAVVAVVLVGLAGWFAFSKMENHKLATPEGVKRVVSLDQGWSEAEAMRYHYTAQGTFLLPLPWLQSLEAGFFTSKKLSDPSILNGARFLTDGVKPDPTYNPEGFPIGWATAAWSPPSATDIKTSADAAVSKNVGFTCATCHTGQLNYKGVGIRIEGGGALMDSDAFQKMVAKAIISTELMPWKRASFIRSVSERTKANPKEVGKALDNAFWKAIAGIRDSFFSPLYTTASYGRTDALQRIANTLFADDLQEPSNNRKGNAPVKFPYLWDIWRLDWVQYNGSVRQPMMRNVGESLGVKAQTNFVDAKGQPNPEPGRWNSSVMTADLFWMEEALGHLKPPAWPSDILPALDARRVAAGRDLFAQRCSGCHGIHVNTTATPTEWEVKMIDADKIGTDPTEVNNFAHYTYSGAKLGLGTLTGGQGLQAVTNKVKAYQYDRLKLTPEQRAAWDGFGRQGDVRAPLAYKARPLVGIWASPPYLHNGAVPTLYDLLSPTRPKTFSLASREYDPVKVGYITTETAGVSSFDTTQVGNSNQGHWFADDKRPGRIGLGLTEDQRYAIIEYLKSATYADYPCTDAKTHQPLTGAVCGQAVEVAKN